MRVSYQGSCGLVNRARSIELGCFFERVLWDLMRFVRNSVPLLPEIGSRVIRSCCTNYFRSTNLVGFVKGDTLSCREARSVVCGFVG
jgi:hypothetical protein